MSTVIKITKENKLNIPVDTILHYTSFFDKFKNDKSDVVRCYIWQSTTGSLNIINEDLVYPDLKGCYVNCILLNWEKEFLYEGDEYYKVFTDDKNTIYHKLEFDGKNHTKALLLKPYKDIVYSNTNFMTTECQRFKTLESAEIYCFKVKNNINVHF